MGGLPSILKRQGNPKITTSPLGPRGGVTESKGSPIMITCIIYNTQHSHVTLEAFPLTACIYYHTPPDPHKLPVFPHTACTCTYSNTLSYSHSYSTHCWSSHTLPAHTPPVRTPHTASLPTHGLYILHLFVLHTLLVFPHTACTIRTPHIASAGIPTRCLCHV